MSQRFDEAKDFARFLKLPHPLRRYQWEGVRFLVESHAALLADQMGLGITVQVSVALETLYQLRKLDRALIVVPAPLKLNWEAELGRWTNSLSIQRVRGDTEDRQAYYLLPINVIIASYEEIRADILNFATMVKFDLVVLDEVQRIKNPGSKTALACKLITRERSWALSGTPLENRIDDLVSIFSFVRAGLIYSGLSRREIHPRIRPYFLRRRKSEVASELPPIIEQEVPLLLEGRQRDAYDLAWRRRWDRIDGRVKESSTVELLAIITRLKQLCNYEPISGESTKMDALRTILESQVEDDDKVIVFSQYVETLKWLSQRIKDIPYALYHGGLSADKKERILDEFRQKPGPRILLMSLRAGGVGLNIQEASSVVLFDRWWNPAVESQAIQRAHRFGRTRPLHVFLFTVKDTIEDRIIEILRRKQALFDQYVENADNAWIPELNRDLLEMVLRAPRVS